MYEANFPPVILNCFHTNPSTCHSHRSSVGDFIARVILVSLSLIKFKPVIAKLTPFYVDNAINFLYV
jgi:hypothetical protein